MCSATLTDLEKHMSLTSQAVMMMMVMTMIANVYMALFFFFLRLC